MFDTVNFWIERVSISGGQPFDVLPYLSEITERQNDKSGYSCTGKAGDYTVNVFEYGISLKGSLAKYLLPSNIYTLGRRDVKQAIEQLSDNLHIDLTVAKVTRLDVSTIIPTKRPPSDYYRYLGNKPYFDRVLSTPDTLYYNNHQRQIIFYDKTLETTAKGVQIPEILQNSNLFRYELRYTKRLNRQLNVDLTAAKLYDVEFYRPVIQRWYNEFKTIQKLKNNSFMIDGISSKKEAKDALFAYLLQQAGQDVKDRYIADLKAGKRFKNRSDYTKLDTELNQILAAPKGEKNELMQELETKMIDIARYAR
jgi:hypothetical protein